MIHWWQWVQSKDAKRGAATVEFAVVVPILLLLLFGIMEFGRAMYVSQALAWSAREGARMYAETQSEADARQTVIDNLRSSGIQEAAIASDKILVATSPKSVTMTVSVEYESVAFVSGFIKSLQGVELKGQAVMSVF